MNGEDLNNESDGSCRSNSLFERELSARLQRARGELTDYAREEGIDLSRPRLTREQLYDRKLARLEMNVANLECGFGNAS